MPFRLVLLKALFFAIVMCSNTVVFSQEFNLDWTPVDSVNKEISSVGQSVSNHHA